MSNINVLEQYQDPIQTNVTRGWCACGRELITVRDETGAIEKRDNICPLCLVKLVWEE